MSDERKLRINPEPLKVVGEGEGLREAFKPYVPPIRCWHQDGRGQCASTDTKPHLVRGIDDVHGRPLTRTYVAHYCPKHHPETPR